MRALRSLRVAAKRTAESLRRQLPVDSKPDRLSVPATAGKLRRRHTVARLHMRPRPAERRADKEAEKANAWPLGQRINVYQNKAARTVVGTGRLEVVRQTLGTNPLPRHPKQPDVTLNVLRLPLGHRPRRRQPVRRVVWQLLILYFRTDVNLVLAFWVVSRRN